MVRWQVRINMQILVLKCWVMFLMKQSYGNQHYSRSAACLCTWGMRCLTCIKLHCRVTTTTCSSARVQDCRVRLCSRPNSPSGAFLCLSDTHTHTHVGFYGLRGLSIGVMVFILYKLYVLLPYTYPTPKLSPHRRRCISIFPQKNSLCMIYKRFKLWGHWKCPHKSPCNTYVIPMSLYKFVSSTT